MSVPEGRTCVQRDKCRVGKKKKKKSFKDERKEVIFISVCSKPVRFLAWIRGQRPVTSHLLLWGRQTAATAAWLTHGSSTGRITVPD